MENLHYTDPSRVTELAADETAPPNVQPYGMPTRHRLRYPNRWYRVYQAAADEGRKPYIVSRGRRLTLDAHTERQLTKN